MEPSQSQVLSEPLLAVMPQLKEKPCHGVRTWNPALHPGQFLANSRTAIGLHFGWSGTASDPVAAPNKNAFGETPQQKKACQDAWNNSALGKGVQFFSLYNLATNITSLKTWAEWTLLPYAKVKGLGLLGNMSSAIGGTELSSVVTAATTTVTAAPVASGIATAESVGASAAPYGIGVATVLDMSASAGCMGMNGDSYFTSGQVGVF